MGPLLRKQVLDLGLGHAVHFAGKVTQDRLFEMYGTHDVLLFPSLHDSSGNVVIEALSFGMPVVCLDLGGPKEMVDSSCGIVISTQQKNVGEVAQSLCDALFKLYSKPEDHVMLRQGALVRAGELTWSNQIDRVFSLIERRIFKDA